MKKKIVIKVQINCEKCRKTAMTVASAAGVDLIEMQGESRDLLVVIGERVDPVSLTTALRKKLSHAALVSVEEVKPPEKEKEQGGQKKPEEVQKEKVEPPPPYQVVQICHRGPALVAVQDYYEPYPNSCSIL